MERIIITEIDNTSNVEPISSYDVVYVPGFAGDGGDRKYYRNPTLVTSKYQFANLFGDTPPEFESIQPYPVTSPTTDGFPTYAIPNYSNLIVDTTPIELTDFTDEDTFDFYYLKVDVVAPQGEDDWMPQENTNYFLREGTASEWGMSYSTLPIGEGQTYVEVYGITGSNNVYMSKISPKALGWYEAGTSEAPYLTGDEQISPNAEQTAIKDYYQTVQDTPPMFNAGDVDPGYRYARYLLSLGIPVYFEQMNSIEYERVVLTVDWTSSLAKYGTDDGSETYISPYENGWYYQENGSYKKCTDDTIKYTSEDDPRLNTDIWYDGADISIDSLYTGLSKRFMSDPAAPDYSFDSIGDYSIKYISSGGYPVFEYGRQQEINDEEDVGVHSGLAYAMMDLARARGDAIALIDHTDNPERSIYETDSLSVIYKARNEMADYDNIVLSHGAMFTPWYFCTHAEITGDAGTNYENTSMPASLAFLSSLASQLRNYNPWLAVSGVTRGKIPYFGSLHTNYQLTNNVADSYQTVPSSVASEYPLVSINPITYIRQYGYCIWGNRTLRNNRAGTKATSFLNIRNVVSDIKKRLFEASQQLLFEQNTDLLWISFKSLITPLLDTMVSNNILSDYRLTKYNIDPESGEPVPAYKVLANIRINPINSVEVFDLTVQLENSEIAVTETE